MGSVVDGLGLPVAGAMVALNGAYSEPLITGADGTFRFESVDDTYVLTVAVDTFFRELSGLRRRDPIVAMELNASYPKTMKLTGTVKSDDPNLFPLTSAAVLLGLNRDMLSGAQANNTDGSFDGTIGWFGAPGGEAELAALQVSTKDDGTFEFPAAGKTRLTLENGGEATNVVVTLGAPVERMTTDLKVETGSYSVDPRLQLLSMKAMGAKFGFGPSGIALSEGEFGFPNGGARIAASGSDDDGNVGLVFASAKAGGTTRFRLPATTTLKGVTPADAATDVSTTPMLGWTPVAGATAYWVYVSGHGWYTLFHLPSSASTLRVPDFSVMGGTLESDDIVEWQVIAFVGAGFASDDVTDGTGAGLYRLYTSESLEAAFQTARRHFTTAP